ncbi:hypothetical protein V6Z11_A05G011700 [Gossypium hirsutum]
MGNFAVWVLAICLIFQSGYGFYLPGSYPHKHVVACYLSVKVNSLTSIDTEMSFSYYSLPFCKPKEGVKDSAENLGELLMGDRIENSPYRFKMYTNETEIFLRQSNKLSADDFKLLKERIDETYQKEGFMLRWTEYPVGFNIEDAYYVFNHLKFKVLVHKYEETNVARMRGTGDAEMVVGFEVVPCSLTHNGNLVKNLKCEPIVFTYEVAFEEIGIKWSSRWDAYLKDGSKVHWTVRRDLTRYEELQKEDQAQMTEELSGWKLVVGDVFRAPSNPALLCIMVGDGVQIIGMAVVTILFAALGFMSPASRGTLITGMLFFYLILGITAGYVSVRLWRTIGCGDHRGWASVAWKAACFFPGIAFLILTTLNFLLRRSHSTGAIPFPLFAPHIEYPVQTNQIPREIPVQNYPSWLLVLGAGTLPFGTLFIELFFIISSIWMGRVYYVFGFLLIVLILLVDWKWWRKSFFASGSVAIYIFLYSINYLVFDLKSLSGPVSATLYLGYSLFMVLAIVFATGTVGFLSSFWFVHYLFSSVKLD